MCFWYMGCMSSIHQNTQNTPCIFSDFYELCLQERVSLVYCTSSVYLVYIAGIFGAKF